MTLPSGARLGPYEITGPLGAGGMGEVYRATDPRLRRDVAIKILPAPLSGDPEWLRRFTEEAKAAGTLNHPNLLVVHDVGEHEGAPYIVSELLEGRTLREAMRASRLPLRTVLSYAQQITAGVAAAHERGIVHRDLKPDNMFITRDGRVKILDFGIAKLVEPAGDDIHAPAVTVSIRRDTGVGVIVGTPGYMSPEQVRGERVDHRTDLFSLGLVLHEMLTGRPAFARDSAVESMHAILAEEPPEISDVPPAVDRIVRHCLEKPPSQRFQSARDVAFAIEGVITPTGAVQPGVPVAPSRDLRSFVPWALASVFVITSGTLGVLFLAPATI